jgi:hypothetical protein
MKAGKNSAIVFLLLSFFLLPGSVQAYSGGSGDSNDPYQIRFVVDLLELAAETDDYNKCFVLTANVDLRFLDPRTTALISPDTNNANSTFDGTAFTGVFDGNGFSILNLTIDTSGAGNDYLGLFGKIGASGQIKNLRLKNVSITSGSNSIYLGGLAGRTTGGTISNCFSTGAVTSGNSASCIGGLVGAAGGTIGNCYSTDAVCGEGNSLNLGGLVGLNLSGTISNCYSTGAVTGGSNSAGIGGLVGWNLSGIIGDCYSAGAVSYGSGPSGVGGLIGGNGGGLIVSCYFLDVSGPNNGLGTPLTDSDMKKQSSFIGWIFPNIWRIREGVSYPKLPYRIGTASNLLTMAANTADYDEYFVLTADINLATSGPFTTAVIAPDTNNSKAGFQGVAFTGVFDGYGFTISNLTVDTGGAGNICLGLFGNISGGEIKNLRLEDVNITGGENSQCLGALAGNSGDGTVSSCCSKGNVTGGGFANYIGGLVGYNYSDISDCCSTGTVIGGDSSNPLGGLVGYNAGGNISNCRSAGGVTGGDDSTYIGGLVGYNAGGGTISNCLSTGNVAGGNHLHSIGGLMGYNTGGDTSNCRSTGNVTGGNNSYDLGGLVGWHESGNISNCFSIGSISGGNNSFYLGGLVGLSYGDISASCSTGTVAGEADSNYLGGLVGWHESGNISDCFSTGFIIGANTSVVGGLAGYSNHGDISYCYSTGDVPGSSNNGNLVGFNNDLGGSTITKCYYLLSKGGTIYNSYGTPLTDKQMKQQKSFVGWDFLGEVANGTDDFWWIKEGIDYPKLFWQLNVTKCTVTAGSKPNTDKISFSGTMGATADNLNGVNTIEVAVYADDLVSPCDPNFPIDAKTLKNGKYNYSGTENGIKKSLTYDAKTHKLSFSASNLDLSGLGCPLIIKLEAGDFNAIAVLGEAIVNAKMPMPIQLMAGVKNVLRVDKCTVKQAKKANTDQLTVSGAFTVEDPNMSMANRISAGLVVTLGTQTFTVPVDKLKPGKGKFSCTKANAAPSGTVSATFDFNRCSFTLTIKNTAITAAGNVDFGVQFTGFDESDEVTLP